MSTRFSFLVASAWVLLFYGNCFKGGNKNPDTLSDVAEFWLTAGDSTILLQKQSGLIPRDTTSNSYATIDVDEEQTFQGIDGFGFTLTGGSAQVINAMDAAQKNNLLQELFGNGPAAISLSYLRISIGASDLNAAAFSYDDVKPGQTDLNLNHFSLDAEKTGGTGLIPLLKEILSINPAIKIIAAPWSPPVWMKDNNSFTGGSLQTKYYEVYAMYFVKYIRQMQAEGIRIDAITPQNEPLNPNNTPSLLMTAEQQRDFIKNNLGPAFHKAGLTTKIIVYDHNCDRPDYVTTILSDSVAGPFVNGSAFHLYGGDISALTPLHNAYPGKDLYFTEQWTAGSAKFKDDLLWHVKNVIIGSIRNWSRVALEWNLANDPSFQPHTPGGCTECKGALTIDGVAVHRNVSYYIVAHASKFVPAGSVRIASNNTASLTCAAFHRTDGKKVLVVVNDDSTAVSFNIKSKGKWLTPSLPAASVGTIVW